MSRGNREKRAAAQRSRRRAGAARERGSWLGADRVGPQEVLVAALRAAARCPCGEVEDHARELLAEFGPGGRELDLAADVAVLHAIRGAWEAGWSPSDLHEMSRRRLEPPVGDCLLQAVVVESRRYAGVTLHPRWHAAVTSIAAEVDDEPGSRLLRSWAERRAASRSTALAVLLQVLAALAELPVLERLLPLPGTGRHAIDPTAEVDRKVLAKVRALLAKAESTEFPDEAEALSGKAQELMSRYSLHQAVQEHGRGRAPSAAGRRLWMDAPYPGAKALLVQVVATANRCRAVWSAEPGFVTVVGADTELDIVELLTTSLLVQANRAMLVAGSQVTRSGTSRTRSFRQSFLVAYATRIGERLDAASTTAASAQAREDAGLLPVLAARSKAADEMTDRLFPTMVRRSVPVSNAAGWGAGRAAADLALFDGHGSIAG